MNMTEYHAGCAAVRPLAWPSLRQVLRTTTALQAVTGIALAAAWLAPAPAAAQLAPTARPTGGQVVAGQASIAQSVTSTTVHQTSQRGVVNWQNFNVGSAHTVDFRQPAPSSVTLNRVIGPNPSEIAGRIQANGQIVVVNQAGLVFDRGAMVNTSGLIVSAAGISNGNFMAGRMVFDQAANPGAKIENKGTITVRNQGLAVLVAPQVKNSGVITAKMGTVILAGAEAHTLDLYGDGLVSINVTRQVHSAPDGTQALVTNTGEIAAKGGVVMLTAEAVDGVVQNLVNAGGRISANSTAARTGRVLITGRGGDVSVDGVVTAEGKAPGSTGGSVQVSGSAATVLKAGARLSVSGQAGGGTIALGTTLARAQGAGTGTAAATTKKLAVHKGATVSADATGKGDGGRVVLLSSDSTDMAGTITAKGGLPGGSGGFVEVSGYSGFSLTGTVDVSAPSGVLGTIRLDPLDLTVGAATTDNGLLGGTAPQMPFNAVPVAVSGNAFISATAVTGLVGNIDLQASRDLFVNSPITLTTLGQTLTLQAGRDLLVAAVGAISTQGDITLTAAAAAPALPTFPAGFSPAGKLTLNGTVTTTGTILLNAGTGGVTLNANVSAATGTLTSSGAISQTAGIITAGTLTGSAGTSATLGGANVVGNLGPFAATAGLTFNDTATPVLTLAGAVNGGTGVGITTNAALAIAGTVSATGTASLTAGGAITETGTVVAGTLTGSAGTSATLGGANVVSNLGPFAATAGLTFSDTATPVLTLASAVNGGTAVGITTNAALAIAGTVSATGTASLTAGGAITETGTVVAATLTGSSSGGATLNQANQIGTLAGFANTGAVGFSLTDALIAGLNVTGPVDAGTGNLALTTTGATGLLTLAGNLTAGPASGTQIVTLTSSGAIRQTGGVITAATLTGSSSGATDLGTATNVIANLGAFAAIGDFKLKDGAALSINGPVSAGTPTVPSFAVDPTNPPLPPAVTVAGTVTITGMSTLTVAGDITARSLSPAGTGISLISTNNFLHSGGRIGTDGTLTITASAGDVQLTGGLITSGGDLSVAAAGNLTQGVHTLSSFGNIVLTAGTGAFTQNSGALIEGYKGVTVTAPTISQAAGGTMAAKNALTLSGGVSQNGALYSATPILGSSGADAEVGGSTIGGTPTYRIGSPAAEPAAGAFAWPGAITVASGAASPTDIFVTGDYIYLQGLVGASNSVQLTATHDIFEHARASSALTGSIVTNRLFGSAGVPGGGTPTLGSALLVDSGNRIAFLGPFAATRNFALKNGLDLHVTGAISAGTALATTPGDVRVRPPSGPGALPDEIAAQTTITASASKPSLLTLDAAGALGVDTAGSLAVGVAPGGIGTHSGATITLTASAPAGITVSGPVTAYAGNAFQTVDDQARIVLTATSGTAPVITVGSTGSLTAASEIFTSSAMQMVLPGLIAMQADQFVLNGAVAAPDGTAALALRNAGTFTLGGAGTLSTASLANISTIGTIGAGNGPLGTQTLALGSLDGLTPASTVTALQINAPIALTGATTLGLFSTGAVTQTAGSTVTVNSLTGSAGSAVLTLANGVAFLGNAQTRGGFTSILPAASGFAATRDFRLTTTTGLTVIGPVTAGSGTPPGGPFATLALVAPTLTIDDVTTSVAGKTGYAGALTVTGAATATTVTPGLISLQTDSLSFTAKTPTDSLVKALDGTVAIARLTSGNQSLDAAKLGGNLSLTQADLAHISTIGPIGAGNGPLGTQTLALGSLDGLTPASTVTALQINAPIALTGIATTLGLFSTGDITEAIAGNLTVDTLTGLAGGQILLNGLVATAAPPFPNAISFLGNTATLGAWTTTGFSAYGDLVATGGNVRLQDNHSLTVRAGSAAAGSSDTELDVLNGGLTVAGTAGRATFTPVSSANTRLRAGSDLLGGDVTIGGLARATANVDIGAGVAYTPNLSTTTYGPASSTGNILIPGTVCTAACDGAAGGVGLYAAADISESGMIGTGNLHGFAGDLASMPGTTLLTNLVGTLGTFSTNNGFYLRDGRTLKVTDTVKDANTTVSIAVAAAGAGPGGYGAADLLLAAQVSAPTVRLQATGNVYEQAGGFLAAGTLTGQAGLIPDTEGSGAAPGTLPTAGTPLPAISLASAIFGSANQVTALGDFTATGNVEFVNGSLASPAPLAVNGKILAGAAPAGLAASGSPASPAQTAALPLPAPAGGFAQAQIVVPNGALTVNGTVEAGFAIAGYPSGNVGLSAGTAGTQGNIVVNGGIGAQNGQALLAAGTSGTYPSITPAMAACTGCTIVIAGSLAPQAQQDTQAIIGLYAANNISQFGFLQAALLQGQAGIVPAAGSAGALGSANLAGATPTTNRIGNLGAFLTTGGFALNDGSALTVSGPVNVGTASLGTPGVGGQTFDATITVAGNPLRIAGSLTDGIPVGGEPDATVLAGGNVSLTAGSILLPGTVSAAPGGNGGGTLTLTADTTIGETGAIVASVLTGGSAGATSLTGSNRVATLANFTAGSGFTLNDTPALAVTGAVNGGPSVTIADAGALSVPGSIAAATVGLSGSGIGIAGSVSGPDGVSLTAAAGDIAASGNIRTSVLTGNAAGNAAFTGSNAIDTLGNFTAGSGFTLNDNPSLRVTGAVNGGTNLTIADAGALSVPGSVTAATVGLSGSGIAIAGSVSGPTGVSLKATGGDITASGSVRTAALTGSATGNTGLTGSNTVANLGDFSTGSGFTLIDTGSLTVTGNLSAGSNVAITGADALALARGSLVTSPNIYLAANSSVSLAGGLAGVQSRGGLNPARQISPAAFPSLPANQIPTGAWIAGPTISVLAGATVRGAGGPADVVIAPANNGTVSFANFNSPATQLYLDLGAGFAKGQIEVRTLQVRYSGTGTGLTLNLLGTVNGRSGSDAAAASFIQPRTKGNYQVNGCPIQSVNCVRVTILTVPIINPLKDLEVLRPQQPDDYLITLPDVGEKDY